MQAVILNCFVILWIHCSRDSETEDSAKPLRPKIFTWGPHQIQVNTVFTFTVIHLADTYIQSDLQLRNKISDSS